MAGNPPTTRRLNTRLVTLLVMVALAAVGGGGYVLWLHRSDNPGCETPDRSTSCTRVLFLGNSYTSVNDLPTMFGDLAWSGGHRVETAAQDPGGWTLADHLNSNDLQSLLTSKPWDIVVLQEQSQIPSVPASRQAIMYPAARQLVRMIHNAGAQPLFYMTWAHRTGWLQEGMRDYISMQASIETGYLTIAKELSAAVAPVGPAWVALVAEQPALGLWSDDGSHPTTAGTYLAASVFYAAIFNASPINLSYQSDLASADAAAVQGIAATTVLSEPSTWGLPVGGSAAG